MESHNSIYKTIYNEEKMFLFFCCGIVISLIFWTLLNSILSIAFFAYWLFFSKKEFSWKLQKSRFLILFCSLYLLVLLGSLYSANTEVALFKIQQKSAFLFLPLILGTSVALTAEVFNNTFRVFIIAVLAGCLVCLGVGVYNYLLTGQSENLYGYNLIILKDMTPFTYSLCCLLAILYLVHKLNLKISSAKKNFLKDILVYLLPIVFLIFFLLVLGNRNLLAITFFICVFYSIRLFTRWWHRLVAIVIMLFVFALAVFVNPSLNRQWNELTDFSKVNTIKLDEDASLARSWGGKQLRMAIWACSWDLIKQKWLTGVGTGDAQDELQEAYEKRMFYFASRYNKYNTHNQYLQETVTYGILGLLIFLACLVTPLFVKLYPQQQLFYSMFLLSFTIACITDTPLDINKGIIWYAFFNPFIFFTYYNFKYKAINGTTPKEF